jgi:peptidoglycan/LPS O-acetylase OafA/YrhL
MRDRTITPTIGQNFNPRSNALNLLRLMFAIMVIFSHSLFLGGFRREVLWGHGSLGDFAVDAFFAVSGFLITSSAARTNVLRYLWQRVLRIFPAFWACLLLTCVVAGPIAWVAARKPLHSYWSAPGGPFHYFAADWLLNMKTYVIAGTPQRVPYPGAWDGSLWTLRWEFACYLMVAALAVTTLLRRRRIVLVLWAFSWTAALGAAADGIPIYTDTFSHDLVRFVPIFFAGSVLWLYKDKIPDSRLTFTAALVAAVGGSFLRNPDVLSGPPLAYVCIWAAIHLPGKKVGVRHDISYGIYIYAFIVGQVLAVWKVYRLGYVTYTLLTLLLTLVLASLSCVAVEQPALRLKRLSPRYGRRYRPRRRSAVGGESGGLLRGAPPAVTGLSEYPLPGLSHAGAEHD